MSVTTLPDLSTPYAVPPEAVSAYARDGHVRLRGVASRGEATAYRAVVRDAVQHLSGDTQPLAERDTYGRAFLQVTNLWRHAQDVARFVLASRFAGVAAQLLGVDAVRLYHDQALFKEPGGGITPWHQDAMYWPLDGRRCLTMWMPLVAIDSDMGTLAFASGTNDIGPLSDESISDASEAHFDRLLADGRHRLPPPARQMAAGDASFHGGWTVHRASPNTGERMREVMTVIWFADGITVREPTNAAQASDLVSWLPGARPGQPAVSELNPRFKQD